MIIARLRYFFGYSGIFRDKRRNLYFQPATRTNRRRFMFLILIPIATITKQYTRRIQWKYPSTLPAIIFTAPFRKMIRFRVSLRYLNFRADETIRRIFPGSRHNTTETLFFILRSRASKTDLASNSVITYNAIEWGNTENSQCAQLVKRIRSLASRLCQHCAISPLLSYATTRSVLYKASTPRKTIAFIFLACRRERVSAGVRRGYVQRAVL